MKHTHKLFFIYLVITSPILNAMAYKDEKIAAAIDAESATATIAIKNRNLIETTSIKKELIIAAVVGASTGLFMAAIKNRDLFTMGLQILSSKINLNKSK